MYITIINDCCDPGTMNRQVVRMATLFPHVHISPVAVGNFADTEASGLIIDTLDAAMGEQGIILANVAPRHGKAKKWPNGTPFGHIAYKNTHIFASVDGLTLSLIKKYGFADSVDVYDIPTVLDKVISEGILDKSMRDPISNSQFRSYEFLPRLSKWFLDGVELPSEPHSLDSFHSSPLSIWYVDNFGNCKTTAWAKDIGHKPGSTVKTRFGEIKCYNRLKDVPDGEPGLTIGSSGFGDNRFVELVVQGVSAAKYFGAQVGDNLI